MLEALRCPVQVPAADPHLGEEGLRVGQEGRPSCRLDEIAAAFDVNRTTVSQHLTVLKGAGLLSERREGTRRIYRARLEGLTGLRAYLDDIWSNALDIARGIAEAEHAGNETRH